MPRTSLTFRLSSLQALADLLTEFALHHDVSASSHDGHEPVIVVETTDTAPALWDVRATIGMFDEAAVEIGRSA